MSMQAVIVKQPGMYTRVEREQFDKEYPLTCLFLSKGDASQLTLGSFEKPSPKDTEILVKVSRHCFKINLKLNSNEPFSHQVKCFALNRMDILQRQGRYPVAEGVSPILGVEVSGVIEAVGKSGKVYNVIFSPLSHL